MKIYLIVFIQVLSFLILLPFAFSQSIIKAKTSRSLTYTQSESISEVRTSNGKIIKLHFSYGLVETIKNSKTLEEQKLNEDDTLILNKGGEFRVIPKVEIPFGKKFGVYWVALNGGPNDFVPLKMEYATIEKKQTFPWDFPVKLKAGQFFIQHETKDKPGLYTITIFQDNRLLFSKTFNVYK